MAGMGVYRSFPPSFTMALSRRSKLLLLLVVTPLLLLGVLLGALLTSPVQTWLARRALGGSGGEVERVGVGLNGAELRGLQITQPGLSVTVPSLRVDLPMSELAGGRVDLRGLVARDLLIEINPEQLEAALETAPAPAPGAAERPLRPFEGVLRAAELPELRVEGVDIAGRLRVSGPGAMEADFSLRGGGVGAGRTGELVLTIAAEAGLGTVTTTFTLSPRLGADGRLEALGGVAEVLAKTVLLAAPARMKATLEIAREGEGETYALRVLAGGAPLVELDTRWAPGAKELPGTWKIAVRDEDLSPFVLGLPLPELELAGGGELVLVGQESVRLGGELRLAADGLQRLGLPALGPVELRSGFELEAGAASVRVERLSAKLAGAGPVAGLEVLQPFSVDLTTRALAPRDPARPLASAALLGVPAEWVALFAPGLTLEGPVTGTWTVRPEVDGVVLVSGDPLIARGVAYAAEGAPLVRFDEVRLEDLRVRQSPAGLEAELGALRVRVAGEELLTLRLGVKGPVGGALALQGALKALPAKLADQPVLRGRTRLSAGLAEVDFEGTLAEAARLGARVRLSGLRASGLDLPAVALEAELQRDAAGVVTARLPLTVTQARGGRVSDLLLAATVSPGAKETRVEARLSGEVLYVDDLQAFAGLAAAPAPAPAARGGVESADVSKGPVWAGLGGVLDVDLKRVVHGSGLELSAQGRVALTPEAAVLERLAAILGSGGAVDLSGALRWLAEERVYALGAEVQGRGVAVGPLLRALQPGETPKLEGEYALAARVSGRGEEPGALGTGLSIELKLSGERGVIRALNFEDNRLARLAGSGAGQLLGLLGGGGRDGGLAGQAAAALEITKQFSNLSYDRLVVEATHRGDGEIELGRVSLDSPLMRLAGGGSLRTLPGRSFLDYPLDLGLRLEASGELARQLERLNLLSAPAGPAGEFVPMVEPLVFDQTLRNVGTRQFMRVLSRAFGL